MTFNELENQITQDIVDVVSRETRNLRDMLAREEPVDTGKSRAGWERIKSGMTFSVVNPVTSENGFHYPQLLWGGSSQQLPLGHDPTYQRWLLNLETSLEGIL